jgi:hypothetical protein
MKPIIISHRGNLDGPNAVFENQKEYITNALEHFNVEIDVRVLNGSIYLGHDRPDLKIEIDFFLEHKSKLWIHCKNLEALSYFKKFDLNYFSHRDDPFVLTSKGFIFTNPSQKPNSVSVYVMPEISNHTDTSLPFAVLTDYPKKYESYYNTFR